MASICLRLHDGRILCAREVIHYPNEFPFAEKRDTVRAQEIEALRPSEPLDVTMERYFTDNSKTRKIKNGQGTKNDEVHASHLLSRGPELREQIRQIEMKTKPPVQDDDVSTPPEKRALDFENGSLGTNDEDYVPFPTDQAMPQECDVNEPIDSEGVEQNTTQKYLPDHGDDTHWREGHCSNKECLVESNKHGTHIIPGPHGTGPIERDRDVPAASTRTAGKTTLLTVLSLLFSPVTGITTENNDLYAPAHECLKHEGVGSNSFFAVYAACINNFSAPVPTYAFDAPTPTTVKTAEKHPNWATPMGWKYAIGKELAHGQR